MPTKHNCGALVFFLNGLNIGVDSSVTAEQQRKTYYVMALYDDVMWTSTENVQGAPKRRATPAARNFVDNKTQGVAERSVVIPMCS